MNEFIAFIHSRRLRSRGWAGVHNASINVYLNIVGRIAEAADVTYMSWQNRTSVETRYSPNRIKTKSPHENVIVLIFAFYRLL